MNFTEGIKSAREFAVIVKKSSLANAFHMQQKEINLLGILSTNINIDSEENKWG